MNKFTYEYFDLKDIMIFHGASNPQLFVSTFLFHHVFCRAIVFFLLFFVVEGSMGQAVSTVFKPANPDMPAGLAVPLSWVRAPGSGGVDTLWADLYQKIDADMHALGSESWVQITGYPEGLFANSNYSMPPLSQSLRFFHTDHLGSASWVTGYTGSALQHLQYLPFGEPWVSQTSNSYEGAKYTFSGKERDKETGLMYFGARYYNPEYGIWNQVDPLHGKYPYQSPFVYCANNPLRVIDPWGLDEWELNKKGQIIKYTKTKEHDKFIINGKEKTFEYGTVTHQARKTLSGKDYDSYKLKGDAKSTELFEFVASNTDVEWSHAKLGIAGNKGLNYLTTSHEEEFENGMSELLYNQLRFGYSLREINHSHPGNVDYPSGSFDYKGKKTGEWGDVGFAKWNNAIFGSKVKFNIFTPKDGKYIPYSAKSKLKDYSGYGKSYHSEFIEFDSKNMLFLQKQYIKPTPFYLKEYKIKDSVFYKSLCNIIFSEISNVEKMMNGDFLSLFIFDSLREFCAIDDSLYKIKIKKSNCTIFSEPKLYKDDITRLNGYFILNNKTFLFYIANKSILHSLFQPVNSSKKFYHYGKMQPWYKLGYSAWHMILKEDNSLQYVGYEIAE